MQDYTPLSLARYCNIGVDFVAKNSPIAIGCRSFWGLPFLIGAAKPNKRKCFIGFLGESGARAPVTVPLRARARHLIFAHRLMESGIWTQGPSGEVVATYVIRYAKGEEIRLPIRDRFEVVASPPLSWGHGAFTAYGDQKPEMMSRKGPFGPAAQDVEVNGEVARNYWLWSWENPHPQRPIESFTIEPGTRNFLLAAVTVSRLAESPFRKQARREVLISLPKPENAGKAFSLDVGVDRGMATWARPLPAQSAETFLKDPMKGWGQEINRKSSPAYVQITATPSATVTVKQDGQTIARANWGQLQKRGKIKTPRAELELADEGRNWVHTTVLDEDTGKPIFCRIHFRSAKGVPYQPHGHHSEARGNLSPAITGTWSHDIGGDLRLGQVSYAYIDGRCQGWLPRGQVIVDVARGYEYTPVRQTVEIKPGQRELVVRLKRWTHMNQKRWFSGDTHCHFLGASGAHREAGGEDLNVVNLLASQWGHLFTNTEDFVGRPVVSDDGQTIVYCSQENRQHLLGHISLLGLKEPVMPWCSDGDGEDALGGNLESTMSHWADACHAQGGTVVLPHFPNPNGEPAALIATGRVDATEFFWLDQFEHGEYYRYLNCGYQLPLVGGTDKMTGDIPVGFYRTYAYIPEDEPFDYDSWCRAVRRGRTFLSSGPLIHFSVNWQQVGDTIRLPGNGGTVEVEAVVESIFPVHCLQIIRDGAVVAATEEAKGSRTLRVTTSLQIEKHSWLSARCAGPGYTPLLRHHDGWQRPVMAHTSPVYVAVGGEWWMFNQDTAQYMLTLIDGCLHHIRHKSLHHEDESVVTHHHTHKDHRAFLESPFHEASAAIHKRMHELGVPH